MKTIEISSKDNEKIKVLKKLRAKKYRNKLNKFVVENLAIIYDGLKSGRQPESLFLTKEIMENRSSKMKIVLGRTELGCVFLISESINKYFSSLETPSGVTAVYDKKKNKELNFDKEIIYLNGIKDPGNMGTILRSAVAFGISNVVIDEFCVDIYNPKVIQAAKDAIFKVNIIFDKNRELLEKIKKNVKIFTTDVENGENISSAFKRKEIFCLVLGSESQGVDEEIKKISDKSVNIKSDSNMESLNVAVSAGIIFHEMYSRK